MNLSPEQIDLLDRYIKGKLSKDEAAAMDRRLASDDEFRWKAEEHFTIIRELKFHEQRKHLMQVLQAAHAEMESPVVTPAPEKTVVMRPAKNYWAISGVAAVVAIISIISTFYITRSIKDEQTAIYRELRRKVDQIKKSQNIMMADMAEDKKEKKKSRGNYVGTGFLISANGYVTTSYHVVKEYDSVYIENEKYGSLKTVVVHSDPANDVSILKIENARLLNLSLPYSIAKTETNLAEEVYTLGYPREDVVFGAGSISALTGYKENPNAYQVSVPVNPGNSGGPLFNSKGDIVGIISGIETQTAGVAFATKSTVLLDVIKNEALDSLHSPLVLSKQNTLRNSTRVEQVKRWKDYVFMVKVFKN